MFCYIKGIRNKALKQMHHNVILRGGAAKSLNRVGDQDTGSPGRPVSSGLNGPVSRGIVVQEQDLLGDFPFAFFLQNVLQLHQQR